MKFLFDLRDNLADEISLAGGKGANLHNLIKSGFNVPKGFIISSEAFHDFLNSNSLYTKIQKELSTIKTKDEPSIFNAASNIQSIIINSRIQPDLQSELDKQLLKYKNTTFAVRSSGVVEDNKQNSWAGQFDSFLGVTKENITSNIKKCWASFFNSRAISYNIKTYKKAQNIKFAVVIQQMVESEKSGIAFSIEPQKNDYSKILIEAILGLGDNIVSGKEVSFSAIVDKNKKILLNKSYASNEYSNLLSMDEIKLLVNNLIKIEKKFGNPVDVEWSFSKNKLYFLQVRPITNLGKAVDQVNKTTSQPDINDYELTFKVAGLSFLFTDMLSSGFSYLDPLFTSDQDANFCQYFTNEKMDYAAKYGMNLFSKPNGFKEYKNEFTDFYQKNIVVLDGLLVNENISYSSVKQFFEILSTLFTYYSKMDNQFTNLAYIYSEENVTIKDNLNQLSQFKDNARLWINSSTIDSDSHFSRFVNRLSDKFNINSYNLECYKIQELLELFEGVYLPFKEIKNRRSSFTLFYLNNKQFYLTGAKSISFINKASSRQDLLLSSEIRDKVANKTQSIVKGNVRLINVDYGNIDQMNQEILDMVKGEILIAEFTAPELISACRKAKAIVTDIGGLLSHAAIVSRELNIPCLVGTANATKNLKTGDKVSIDFDLGIVTKI